LSHFVNVTHHICEYGYGVITFIIRVNLRWKMRNENV